MNAQDGIIQFLTTLLTSSPYLLVLLGGLVLAFVQMGKRPQMALLMALGTGILLANFVLLTGVQIFGIQSISRNGNSIQIFFQIMGLARSMLSALGIGLLLAACLAGRPDVPAK